MRKKILYERRYQCFGCPTWSIEESAMKAHIRNVHKAYPKKLRLRR